MKLRDWKLAIVVFHVVNNSYGMVNECLKLHTRCRYILWKQYEQLAYKLFILPSCNIFTVKCKAGKQYNSLNNGEYTVCRCRTHNKIVLGSNRVPIGWPYNANAKYIQRYACGDAGGRAIRPAYALS